MSIGKMKNVKKSFSQVVKEKKEGVINFVSLRFYLPMISSIGYCQNFQYLQGFVGSAHTRPPE